MTVSKRKSTGSWTCDFYYNGQRIQRTLKFARTKKEAEQAEAVIMNQVFQQAYGLDKKPDKRFEDFIVETFLPYSEANKKSFYLDVLICRVLVDAFKGKTLRQITPPVIESFKQKFLATPTKFGRKRSKTSVNYHLSILSKIFSLAVDADLIESNPSFKVKKLKNNNQRERVLSDDEESRLFDSLGENHLVKNIVTAALHTGMRRGEIFNLRWFDVDFKRELIQVRESKSGKKRLVPMNATVKELLTRLERNSEYVFPSPKTNGKLTDIKHSLTRALKVAQIEEFCFHDLRHTAASRMADAGADAFTLMKILGHSDIRMTTRYTHATDKAIRRAVTNLDASRQFSDQSVTEVKRQPSRLP
ncbi:MAG TPA: tyrosine-type recombinase/integrase [Pyrinomonadaceae bacterium]|nr:tyrosine-type recombinase/integrase [Pyrinomonadaceae bacterium]